jgi:hypothetical protein
VAIPITNNGFVGTGPDLGAVVAAVEAALVAVDAFDDAAPHAGAKVRAANELSSILVAGSAAVPAIDVRYKTEARLVGAVGGTAPRLPHGALVAAAILAQPATATATVAVNGVPIATDALGVASYGALATALGFA